MEMIITPTYSDLFDGKVPELDQLLFDIPSELTLSILSKMNAELYI